MNITNISLSKYNNYNLEVISEYTKIYFKSIRCLEFNITYNSDYKFTANIYLDRIFYQPNPTLGVKLLYNISEYTYSFDWLYYDKLNPTFNELFIPISFTKNMVYPKMSSYSSNNSITTNLNIEPPTSNIEYYYNSILNTIDKMKHDAQLIQTMNNLIKQQLIKEL